MFRHKVSFAGAGKAASALCRRMHETGIPLDLVVSLSEGRGGALARDCGARWSSLPVFPGSTEIIIVAVPDHSLRKVLESIRCSETALVVHTAGSYGVDIFPDNFLRKGVFYPLQTFSAGRHVEFSGLPFLLESPDPGSSAVLGELAVAMGGIPRFISAEQRKMVHLAAVFICNFTNHMLTSGKLISDKAGVPFEIFIPLIWETVNKAIDIGPENSQTGPAVRNDSNTVGKHLEMLSFSPDLREIYSELTKSIINYYNKS